MSAPTADRSTPVFDVPEELRAAEAEALRRLRQLARSEDEKLALRVCEVIVRFASQCRRDQARIAVETARAEATREKTAAARAVTAARQAMWNPDPAPRRTAADPVRPAAPA